MPDLEEQNKVVQIAVVTCIKNTIKARLLTREKSHILVRKKY
jgi:hypothetical protein